MHQNNALRLSLSLAFLCIIARLAHESGTTFAVMFGAFLTVCSMLREAPSRGPVGCPPPAGR